MITDITYKEHLTNQNTARVTEQSKLFAYYLNSETDIVTSLKTALQITFNDSTLEDFQMFWINIVTKAIDQLSIVYRDPATRQLIIDGEVKSEKVEGEEPKASKGEILTEYFNSLLYAVNSSDNTALRYAKLANTSVTAVRFDRGKIKYKVLPTWLYNVKVSEHDPYKMEAISYRTYYGDKVYHVVWTEKEHYMVEELNFNKITFAGDKETVPTMKDTKNPYGIIPYAVLRLKEQGDFHGNGQTDLVNGNEQINIIMTELMNEHILMGSAGMVFAVNCRLATMGKDGKTIDYSRAEVPIGRKRPLVLENVKPEDTPPSLDFVSTDPQTLELRDTIDWSIKMFAMSKGLNPNSFLADVQATSGFSKLVDAMEQMELRKDDIEPCRIYEDDRFEITRKVNNYHANTTDGIKYGMQVIPDNAYMKVDFAEVSQPMTADEQQKDDDWNLKHNLISVYDIARRQNPDLDDDELAESIAKNKAINDLYKVEPIINNQNTKELSN